MSAMWLFLKNNGKHAVRAVIPLSMRKRIATWIHGQEWINSDRRAWWSAELIRDFVGKDANAYHKFLWAHHLDYAAPYEVETRFGPENMRSSRRIFFSELRLCLEALGLLPEQIRSVLEIGCSLGYQLRYLETDLFSEATVLEGIDIDQYAIQCGQKHLRGVRSKVSLSCGDIQHLDPLLGDRIYDVLICSGVLMYLKQTEAAEVVRAMLAHSRVMVAMAGLAYPALDNADLSASQVRERDQTFIHNLDRMVKDAGGSVLARRWDGDRKVDGQTIYFVFAAPR